jgi:predicted PurR-regulated permease PerM
MIVKVMPFYAKLALVLIGLIALGFLVVHGKEILDPLMFGFLFAILLLPIGNFLERRLRLPRSAASFVAILLLVGFVSGIIYLVGSQINNLTSDWPQLKNQINQSAGDVQGWIESKFHVNVQKQMNYIHNTTNKVLSSGTTVLSETFLSLGSLFLFYIFITIFTFFILFYRRLLFRFVLWVFGKDDEPVVHDIAENIQKILRQYILGLLLEMLVVSCMACTAFWIIGIKYAALLGIITGLFNIIPYVGIYSALLLSAVITFATGAASKALIVAIVVICIHAVDSNLLLPIIVGSKVRLNALITFLGILLGEVMWGLSGMFLSIPTIAILKIIFDRIEPLKPWGFLLGGEYEYKESAEKEMKTE